jgi:hypothetical protein
VNSTSGNKNLHNVKDLIASGNIESKGNRVMTQNTKYKIRRTGENKWASIRICGSGCEDNQDINVYNNNISAKDKGTYFTT